MRIVGLTGGIATGKSTVTNVVRRSGVPIIDCDELAHLVSKKVSPNRKVHPPKWWHTFMRTLQGVLTTTGSVGL